ncbi:hypothetical protein [Sulfurivermis fontis]|uniref:hypothetical protein n=1 Tax=Sulfurivermis fontis TaxID=1972068 RepID=UPI001559217E|nr:hypothetical protein [Sulfurivermis fontis]
MNTLHYLLLLSALLLPLPGAAQDDSSVVVLPAQGDYEFVVDSVKEAIINRGMTVSGTLHVSEMLARTAPDLGYDGTPYARAESIEFCSAVLSQRMVRADIRNLVICPFTVAVYTPREAPQQVYVAFRRHRLAGNDPALEQAVFDLLYAVAGEAAQ